MEVTSLSSDDKDGDGIKDSVDRCMYIARYYDEVTGEDLCRAHPTTGAQTGKAVNAGGLAAKSDGAALSSQALNQDNITPEDFAVTELAMGGIVSKIEEGQRTFPLKVLLSIIGFTATGGGLIIRRIYEKKRK
jgi:hypothetical protein